MRLSENSKAIILSNNYLLNFVNEHALDMSKIEKCNIESLGDNCYVFCMVKNNYPKSKQILPLDNDIATQPDIALIFNVDNGNISIESTNKTRELLSLNKG